MKIALIGTCRISSVRSHFDCTDFDNAISFVHSTKEILQLLRFITRRIEIPDPINRFCFRTAILNRQPVPYSESFLRQFDEADLFVIEICAMRKYMYQGYYLHHLAVDRLFPFYVDSPQDVLLQTTIEHQDRQEIEEDISGIADMLYPRKMMIISHINASIGMDDADLKKGGLRAAFNRMKCFMIPSANEAYQGDPKLKSATIEKREHLINILQSIAQNKGIHFFDPSIIFKRYRQKKVIQFEKNGLPPSHYTDFGNKVIGRLYAEEIKRIIKCG